MLHRRRSDAGDRSDPAVEEYQFHALGRVCAYVAGFAVVFAILDAPPVKTSLTAASVQARHYSLVNLPLAVWSQLNMVAFAARRPVVAQRDDVTSGTAAYSPIAEARSLADPTPVKVTTYAPPPKETPRTPTAKPEVSVARPPSTTSDMQAATAAPPASTAEPQPSAAKPQLEPYKVASIDSNDKPQTTPALPPPMPLPATIAVLPRPAPPQSPAQRLGLTGKSRAHAEDCLARAIYFEARDQPFRGQVAVAQVVMNRVFSGVYPRDVCGVIYQNANHHLACQFTFACDGKPDIPHERGAWRRARRIANDTLDGKLYVSAVGTATHYHATYVHPRWVHEMHRYAREGEHLFYRPTAWGNGADEPIWSRREPAPKRRKR